MPRFGQYAFYMAIAGISLLTGTLPFVLSGFLTLALIWFSLMFIYQVLIVKKKAPIIEPGEVFKRKKSSYDLTNLNPVMLESLNDLNHYFSQGNNGSFEAINNSFCKHYGLPSVGHDPFLLVKKILFEYKKRTGSLTKKVIQLNKIHLPALLEVMGPVEIKEFQDFCENIEKS